MLNGGKGTKDNGAAVESAAQAARLALQQAAQVGPQPPSLENTPSSLAGFSLSYSCGTTWMPSYQRNNKSKGAKNLRCFPHCSNIGHQESFCGRSVKVVLQYPPQAIRNPRGLVAVAEFSLEDTPLRRAGTMVTLNEINKHGDDAKDAMTFMQGMQVRGVETEAYEELKGSSQVSLFEYNKTLKGWHYGYLGSKKTRNLFHNFRCYILEKVDGQYQNGHELHRVLASCVSPPFQMYCRRRKDMKAKMKLVREAMHEQQQQQQMGNQNNVNMTNVKRDQQLLHHSMPPTVPRENLGIERQQQFLVLQAEQAAARQQQALKKKIASGSPVLDFATVGRRGSDADAHQEHSLKRRSDSSAMSIDGQRHHVRRRSEPPISSGGDVQMQYYASSPQQQQQRLQGDQRWEIVTALLDQLGLPSPLRPHSFSLNSNDGFSGFAQTMQLFLLHLDQLRGMAPAVPPHIEAYTRNHKSITEADHFKLFVLSSGAFADNVRAFVSDEIRTGHANEYRVTQFGLELFTNMLSHFLENPSADKKQKSALPTLKAGNSFYSAHQLQNLLVSPMSPTGLLSTFSTRGGDKTFNFPLASPKTLDADMMCISSDANVDDIDWSILQATPRNRDDGSRTAGPKTNVRQNLHIDTGLQQQTSKTVRHAKKPMVNKACPPKLNLAAIGSNSLTSNGSFLLSPNGGGGLRIYSPRKTRL